MTAPGDDDPDQDTICGDIDDCPYDSENDADNDGILNRYDNDSDNHYHLQENMSYSFSIIDCASNLFPKFSDK